MGTIQWKFTIPLEKEKAPEIFEVKNFYQLPIEYKDFVRKHNAGMPTSGNFKTNSGEERVLKGLLSLNENDEENVYTFLDYFKKDDKLETFPFAIDPFGNLICFKNNEIVLWNHESEGFVKVARTFSEFINSLY